MTYRVDNRQIRKRELKTPRFLRAKQASEWCKEKEQTFERRTNGERCAVLVMVGDVGCQKYQPSIPGMHLKASVADPEAIERTDTIIGPTFSHHRA